MTEYEIQLRGDTGAQWATTNPVLAQREIGIEVDATPPSIKIGNGVTPWVGLPYAVGDDLSPQITQLINDTATQAQANLTTFATGLSASSQTLVVSNASGTVTVPLTATFDAAGRVVTFGYRQVKIIPASGASSIDVQFSNYPTDGSPVRASVQIQTLPTGGVPTFTIQGAAPSVVPTTTLQTVIYELLSLDGTAPLLIANTPIVNTVPSGSVPGTPSTPTVVAGDGQATVTWTTVATATSYIVQVITAGGTPAPYEIAAVTGLSTTALGLTNGTGYTFKVRALNSYGSSALSTASSSATPAAGAGGDPNHLIQYSITPDRASPVSLDAASALRGTIYVQVILAAGVTLTPAASGGAGIAFSVDGVAANVEYTPPWDLNGASTANVPNGLDLVALGNGTHTVFVTCDTSAGVKTATATFTVTNVFGTLTGTATVSGVGLASATVNAALTDLDTAHAFTATTASNGTYSIANIPPGAYKVWAVKAGYVSGASVNATIAANTTTSGITPTLTVGVGEVPSYGPNGTHSPTKTPAINATSSVTVACSWAAIATAITTGLTTATGGTYVIDVSPGTLTGGSIGGGGQAVLKTILGPTGNLGANRTMRVLVRPLSGYGTVVVNGGMKVVDVNGVTFANLIVNGGIHMDCSNSAWWRVKTNDVKSRRSVGCELVEVWAEKTVADDDDTCDLWAADGDQVNMILNGCWFGPSWQLAGSGKHIDTIQHEPFSGHITNSVTFKNCFIVGRHETNGIIGNFTLSHTLTLTQNSMSSWYPTPSGGSVYFGTQILNGGNLPATNGGHTKYFSDWTGVGVINYTGQGSSSVTNSRLNGSVSGNFITGFTAITTSATALAPPRVTASSLTAMWT